MSFLFLFVYMCLFMLFIPVNFSRKKKKNSPDNLIYYTTLFLESLFVFLDKSVLVNTVTFQNFIIICLKKIKFYFTTIRVAPFGLLHFLKQRGILFNFSFAASFQKTIASIFNKVCFFAKYKFHRRCLISKFSEIVIPAYRKIFSEFYPIFHETFSDREGIT